MLAIVAPAVAVKVAVVEPAGTVTDEGTFSSMSLLESAMVEPPVGAVWVSVTAQALVPLWLRLVGLQATPETSTGACKPIAAACELAPSVAVTVPL